MTVTTYAQWKADGSPWKPSQPVADLAETLRAHHFVVYEIGNLAHLTAKTPEDHTPYSHTPWPGAQPYPFVLAMDVMPGGDMDWHTLAQRLIADKRAGLPGARAIKYINWTDTHNKVWHTKWEPNESTTPSTDSGHIHISFRTDYVGSTEMHGYDPLAFVPIAQPTTPIKKIVEDGKLGPETIARWEQVMGTPRDGKISTPSELVKAVQTHLNEVTHRGLKVDGLGLVQDGHSRTLTIGALELYAGQKQDGYLSVPSSGTIKWVQQRLNTGKF